MLHFGIIGAGNIAHKFIEAVRMTTEADVTAVASKSMERAKAWAKKESLSLYYDSYEKLLADPDIDVVYIATLSNAHYDNIKACLLAGKHVICEKPMTQTGAQARVPSSSTDTKLTELKTISPSQVQTHNRYITAV